jgi:hypothetical protein
LADHAIHAIRRLTLGNARPPRHAFRDFRLLHPISAYQRGVSQPSFPAAHFLLTHSFFGRFCFVSDPEFLVTGHMNRF